MLQNYFKIAIRNLRRHKVFTAINIAGLTTGLTCCLLMILYIQNELSFDRFHSKGDRIVRMIMEYSLNGGAINKGNFTSTKVLPSFKKNFGEVESGVRLFPTNRLVKAGDKVFDEKRFIYADSTFFDVFSFHLLRGQPGVVLQASKQVVISATMARKYFGEEDPIGKTLLVGSKQEPYQVTGVMEDCPPNSQLQFDFVASLSSFGSAQEDSYFNANYTTYLLLKNLTSIYTLQKKIRPFMDGELKNEKGVMINYELEPLTKVHLYSAFDSMVPNSNIIYVYIIGAIALLVLLIACFTYINLSTARSMERAKEVGIRKVSGAVKGQLLFQFISESMVITLTSLLFSVGIVMMLLPAFNNLAGTQLKVDNVITFPILLASIGLVLVISLLAGTYPAFILSNFQPVKVLKGSFKNSDSGTLLRKSLIVFQFVISVFLIISTLVISGQLHFIQNKKIGYDRDHVLVLPLDQKIIDKLPLLKNIFKSHPSIQSVSAAYESPVSIKGGYSMRRGDAPASAEMNVFANPVDEDYLKVNSLSILYGEDFSHQDVLDASKEDFTKCYYRFIINESAAKSLGLSPKEAIGKKLFLGDDRPGEIKAVIRDFHFASLHATIQPLVLFPGGWPTCLLVKTSGVQLPVTITYMATQWNQLAPHRPFEYHFMNEDFDKMYETEMKTAKVFNLFSGIALLLACLGLFGLSAFIVKQKIKEIGIRKVVGASIGNILFLISNTFIRLVLIAVIIAFPIAWWAMNNWLEGFAYKIHLSIWFFVIAAIAVIVIALLTVSLQAVKAAMANPVKSLRTE